MKPSLLKKMVFNYTKDTNKPYSGPVFSLYEAGGQKREELTFKNGKRDGLYTRRHAGIVDHRSSIAAFRSVIKEFSEGV